ncbi:hypothetical protein TNCV_3101021 [Trichonephila clavipes]|nr:hypothetical protein TNCV_3101021 [Trichonephila clavipes]
MLIVIALSILERSVRAVDEAGVVIQRYPMHAQLETYLVISQAKVTSQHSVLHIALQRGVGRALSCWKTPTWMLLRKGGTVG